MQLPYCPALNSWAFYPREVKNYVHVKNSIGMFIATLLIRDKKYNQPRRP